MKKTPSDSSYERWIRKQRERDADMFRRGEEHYKHLRGLKGRIQNNLSGFLRIILTAFIVLIQFVMIIMLPLLLQNQTVYFYFILEIVAVIAC